MKSIKDKAWFEPLAGGLIAAIVISLFTWVFNVSADVHVLKTQHKEHVAQEAHVNTRQTQISELKGHLLAHESQLAHPDAQEIIIALQQQQASYRAEQQAIRRQLDRILDKLDNGPRPR